jgi:hypothetical protein
VEELVYRLQVYEQEHAAAQAAALKRAEDAIKRQEEAIAQRDQEAEERQRLLLAKQAEHYQAEMKKQEALMMAKMKSMFAEFSTRAQLPVGGAALLAKQHALETSAPEPPSTSTPALHSSAMEIGLPDNPSGFPDAMTMDMAADCHELQASPLIPPPLPDAVAPRVPPPPAIEIGAGDIEMRDAFRLEAEREILTQAPPAQEAPEYSSGGHLND